MTLFHRFMNYIFHSHKHFNIIFAIICRQSTNKKSLIVQIQNTADLCSSSWIECLLSEKQVHCFFVVVFWGAHAVIPPNLLGHNRYAAALCHQQGKVMSQNVVFVLPLCSALASGSWHFYQWLPISHLSVLIITRSLLKWQRTQNWDVALFVLHPGFSVRATQEASEGVQGTGLLWWTYCRLQNLAVEWYYILLITP